jgi:hypothetical protein
VTDQEGRSFRTILMPSGSSVLDMAWHTLSGSAHLVVLSTHGQHLYFPCHFVEDQFNLEGFLEDFVFDAHSHLGPFKYGRLTCHNSTIASTTGDEVVVRGHLSDHTRAILSFLFITKLKTSSSSS